MRQGNTKRLDWENNPPGRYPIDARKDSYPIAAICNAFLRFKQSAMFSSRSQRIRGGKHISSVSGDLGRSDVDMEIVSRLGDLCDKTAYKPPYLNRYAIRVDL